MTEPRPLSELKTLKGVGPLRSQYLERQGLRRIQDLIGFLPRRYRLLPAPVDIAACQPGDLATIVGEITSSRRIRSRRRGPGHLQIQVRDGTAAAQVDFFNQGFLQERLRKGERVLVSGTMKEATMPVLQPVFHRLLDSEEIALMEPRFLLDYAAIEGIKPGELQNLIREALATGLGKLEDPLSQELRNRRQLASLREALGDAHQPRSLDSLARAERRLVYNACLIAALKVEAAKEGRGVASYEAILRDVGREARILETFPFQLTAAQSRALEDIYADLSRQNPMRRLLQGDVGSGKTAVALSAALNVALEGGQVALMAPTEVLARQLHENVSRMAEVLGLETCLVLGRSRAAERRDISAALASGRTQIAVGTQALFRSSLAYRRLSLVVVDEQHRFGVMQRLKLVRKGRAPHLLAMSATPIPRSLALTLYSDMDLSILDERPPGRKSIETRVLCKELNGAYDWRAVASEARLGQKSYVVFPAVESEESSIASLLIDGRKIASRYFKGIKMAALHGRMEAEEKQRNLEAFRKGDVSVLFATTVIEVGVDVPDARRIIIVDASRFGLAQLHQLRGRVGRGGEEGYCDLLVSSKRAADSDRLRLLEETEDGFMIAERDLELRGPGDMMGLRQHGNFPVMPAQDDEGLLLASFEDARSLIDSGIDVEALIERLSSFVRNKRGPSLDFMEAG